MNDSSASGRRGCKMALDADHRGPVGNFPETRYCEQPQPPPIRRRTKIAMACVATACLVWLASRRWRS